MSPLICTESPEAALRVLPIWLLDVKDLLLCMLMMPSLFPWLLGVRGRDSKLFGVTGLLLGVDGVGGLLVCVPGVGGLLFATLETCVLLLLGSGGDLFPWSCMFFPVWVGTWGLGFWPCVAWRLPWWSDVTKLWCWIVGLLESLASSHNARSFSISVHTHTNKKGKKARNSLTVSLWFKTLIDFLQHKRQPEAVQTKSIHP